MAPLPRCLLAVTQSFHFPHVFRDNSRLPDKAKSFPLGLGRIVFTKCGCEELDKILYTCSETLWAIHYLLQSSFF